MKKIITVFYILVFLMSLNALDVSGNQSGTWTLANSPYTITGDITVPENLSLTIEAGVEVLFAGNFRLTALGRVEAIGTEESMITFKAATDSEVVTHKGIRLEYEGAEANLFDYCLFKNGERGVNSINSPVNITNSHFTYNDDGIHVFAIGNTNPPPILIEDNLIENSVKSGISINESSAVTITNNEITGNGTGPQFRGAIQVSIQSSSAVVEPTITNNNIHGNHYQGITCVDMFSCGGINAFISENTIDNNYTGVYFYNCTGRLVNNVITNNFIPGDMNSGAGVMCYGNGATPYIAGNQISGNYGGIFITVGAQPIIGNPDLEHEYSYGLNTIEANIDVNDVTNSVILNNLSSDITIMAKNNFWGTTDLAEIDASITDSNDDPALGTVEYLPLAEEISEYILNVAITSDIADSDDEDIYYVLHLFDLVEQTSENVIVPLGTSAISFEEPITFTISGTFYQNSIAQKGHCYYGEFDEPTIITLGEDNLEESVELHFNLEPRPKTFRTYDFVEVNGVQAIPLFKDEVYSERVKQLLYENDDNDIMLVGYQKYGLTGWESVLLEEEVLYLKNDALPEESFTGYQFLYLDDTIALYPQIVEVKGSHEIFVTGNENPIEAKALFMTLDIYNRPGSDCSWYEFTGNSAPLSINPRGDEWSHFYAEDTNYAGTFDDTKLLTLLPNTTVDYYSRVELNAPTNLTLINEILYWNPCSIHSGNLTEYQLFWETEINHEVVVDSYLIDTPFVALSELNLGFGEYTFWVIAITTEGESESSNQITYSVVSNDNNSVEPFRQLLGNYPNPFNPETTIFYNLESESRVELTIYNLKGQKVRSLVNELQPKGHHQIVWNGTDDNDKNCSSGVYFYKLRNGRFSSTKKMILMK